MVAASSGTGVRERSWSTQLVIWALWGVVISAGAVTWYWITWAGTDRWRDASRWRDFPMHLNDGCDPTQVLDNCQLQQLIYLWLPTAAAALAAIPLLSLGAHLRPSFPSAAARQLPPRCFWASWCGGISVVDAGVILAWVVVNVAWLGAIMYRYEMIASFFRGLPPWRLQWVLISAALGQLLTPNLVMLLYPVTRGSVLLQVTGVSYPSAIRYHRWLGHATLLIATAHSMGFWGAWLLEGPHTFFHNALEQGSRINNLMGGISFVSGLALWLTSLERARRWNYELFYKMHHVGFWGFMLMGCMHYSPLFWAFLPGMMLYAVDAVYRLNQVFGRPAVVLKAHTSEDAHVASLTLSASPWGVSSTGYVWINAPAISRTEWHPFEYIMEDSEACGQSPALNIHTKAYNRWTKKFVSFVQQQGTAMQVRIEGPYPELPPQGGGKADKGLVLVGGGIGITAVLSVLKELMHHEGPANKTGPDNVEARPPPPRALPVLLVWSARHTSELTLLAPKVYHMAEEAGVNLQVHLHFTGDPKDLFQCVAQGMHNMDAGVPPQSQTNGHFFVLEWETSNGLTNGNGLTGGSLTNGDSLTNRNGLTGGSLTNRNGLTNGNGLTNSDVLTNGNGLTIRDSLTNGNGLTGGSLTNHGLTNGSLTSNGLTNGTLTNGNTLTNGSLTNGNALTSNAGSYSISAQSHNPSSAVPTPLCPVLALHSTAQQAVHKLQMHAVVFGGALIALLMVTLVGSVRASQEWPTAWLGAAYVIGICVCTLVPGFVMLGIWKLVSNCLGKCEDGGKTGANGVLGEMGANGVLGEMGRDVGVRVGEGKKKKSSAGRSLGNGRVMGEGRDEREDLEQPLLDAMEQEGEREEGGERARQGEDGERQEGGERGGRRASLNVADVTRHARVRYVVVDSTSASVESSGALPQTLLRSTAGLKYEFSSNARVRDASAGYGWVINLGRPPLERIVKNWLGGLEQVACMVGDTEGGREAQEEAQEEDKAEEGVIRFCAMGPEAMVLSAQMLCDDLNRKGRVRGGRGGGLKLQFERKTFDL